MEILYTSGMSTFWSRRRQLMMMMMRRHVGEVGPFGELSYQSLFLDKQTLCGYDWVCLQTQFVYIFMALYCLSVSYWAIIKHWLMSHSLFSNVIYLWRLNNISHSWERSVNTRVRIQVTCPTRRPRLTVPSVLVCKPHRASKYSD